MMEKYDMITILGPTACGKTKFAVRLADVLNAEIISADSRQVYQNMDIGTGKDLSDYTYQGKTIPYHLIDIVPAGYKYNLYEYQRDFIDTYHTIKAKEKNIILCGGSGLYLESIIKGYQLSHVPQNPELRAALAGKSLEELTEILAELRPLHNQTDTDTHQRAIRAIEIEKYNQEHPLGTRNFPKISSLTIGLSISRELRRERISKRLKARLDGGMIDEVQQLLEQGLTAEQLIYYGLEYKYITLFLTQQISYQEMFSQLEIAIHQFAKRQMTWFRGMEKRGIMIHWVDANEEDFYLSGIDTVKALTICQK